MKKIVFALLVICAGFFVACSDSDDNSRNDNTVNVVGVYDGDLKVTIVGMPAAIDSKDKISLTRTGENKVKLELKEFAFGGQTIGDIIIKDVPVVVKGDGYALQETTSELIIGVMPATTTVTGTIIGKTLSLVLNVETPMPGAQVEGQKMYINVTFDGDKVVAK